MNRLLSRAACTAVLIVVGGCAMPPQATDPGPFPADYKAVLQRHLARSLFDPYSVRSASISWPEAGHLFFQAGWLVCAEFNAKNRMGGYVGLQRTAYLLRENEVVRTMDKAPLCNDVRMKYSPWPEAEQAK